MSEPDTRQAWSEVNKRLMLLISDYAFKALW